MTTNPHEIRNWLHQLLSSIEAAMPDVTALCFSQHQPLVIVTPYPNTDFTEWQPLADALEGHLGGLRPGAVRYRLIENVTLNGDTLPAEMPLPLQIQWHVSFFRRGEAPLEPLQCVATLIREEGELVTTRLIATVIDTSAPETPLDPPAPPVDSTEAEETPPAEIPTETAPDDPPSAPMAVPDQTE